VRQLQVEVVEITALKRVEVGPDGRDVFVGGHAIVPNAI